MTGRRPRNRALAWLNMDLAPLAARYIELLTVEGCSREIARTRLGYFRQHQIYKRLVQIPGVREAELAARDTRRFRSKSLISAAAEATNMTQVDVDSIWIDKRPKSNRLKGNGRGRWATGR